MSIFGSHPSSSVLTTPRGLAAILTLALLSRFAGAQTPGTEKKEVEKKEAAPGPVLGPAGSAAAPSVKPPVASPAPAPAQAGPKAQAPAAGPKVQAPGAQVGGPKVAGPQVEAPLPAPPRTNDPQAIAIVENYLKAIGGKELLAKIKDRAVKFRNIKHQATGETVAEIHLFIKDGINFREEWNIEGFDIKGEPLAFSQIYNGESQEGWVYMMKTVSPLDGRTLQVFVFDKYMDDFFCHWEQDGYTVSLGGQGLVSKELYGEDVPCDIVLVTDFSGRQVQRHFFSKKDGLLIKKEWQEVGVQQKASVKKERYYKQYRDIAFLDNSGLSQKTALRHEIYIDGDLDSEQVFTSVRINSGLSPKLFEKPEGKPFDRAITESPKVNPAGPAAAPSGVHGTKGKGAITPVKVHPPEGPKAVDVPKAPEDSKTPEAPKVVPPPQAPAKSP
jgi:hypothetical protein